MALPVIFMAAAICACNPAVNSDTPQKTETVDLHTLEDFSDEEVVLNSHVGYEANCVLQPVYRSFVVLEHSSLIKDVPSDQETAMYPRIKKLHDGSFIMFFHGGQHGSRIWCMKSSDLIHWTAPMLLFEPEKVMVTETSGTQVSDWRRFVNMDAAVLDNGEILAVCSYRASGHYGDGLDCGLMTISSNDNGVTWTSPQQIYKGPNWEPYLLLLPDSRIQCYFTDATPQTRNSGTSVIESMDGGRTWSAKKRCCRLYKYDYKTADPAKKKYNGEKIFTDQMPCFRVLNDGKTLVGFLEDRLEEPEPSDCAIDNTYGSSYKMSIVYNDGFDWEDLGENSEGPADRISKAGKGAGGYISCFKSGETVFSCGINSLLSFRLADATARNFNGGTQWEDGRMEAFEGSGFWGCTEVVGPRMLAAAMHCSKGLQIGQFYLNHMVVASERTVKVDGDPSDWNGIGSPLYISSKNGMETIFRFSADADNIYILIDRHDPMAAICSDVRLCLSDASGRSRTDFIACAEGLKDGSQGISVKTSKAGRKGTHETGLVYEIALNRSLIGNLSAEDIRFYADVIDSSSSNTFSLSDINAPSTWQVVKIK